MNYRKTLLSLVALATSFFLSGCDYGDIKISNLTPATLAENNSDVYTLTASVKPMTTNVVDGSLNVNIVIDGETFPMQDSPLSSDLYEFEYHLPEGRQDASYYFLVDYQVEIRGFTKTREAFSSVHSFKLANRYAYSLDVTRAPVGSKVGVVGRGFKRTDAITIGGANAPTTYNSSNSMHFHVPSLEAGNSYPVQLSDGNSTLDVGTLRVDPGSISVSPSSISVREGERQMVIFSVKSEAPEGGLYIDVSTNAPESVIMPEVVIPGGSRSVNIPVEGGKPGKGELFVEMDGYNTVTVPVTVR